MTAAQLLLPPIDKIAENLGVKKQVQEERTDTHTVFSKDSAPQTFKGTSAPTEKNTETRPSGNCSSYWVRMHFTKQGPICYNTCGKEMTCN